jgi:hypothetical protein
MSTAAHAGVAPASGESLRTPLVGCPRSPHKRFIHFQDRVRKENRHLRTCANLPSLFPPSPIPRLTPPSLFSSIFQPSTPPVMHCRPPRVPRCRRVSRHRRRPHLGQARALSGGDEQRSKQPRRSHGGFGRRHRRARRHRWRDRVGFQQHIPGGGGHGAHAAGAPGGAGVHGKGRGGVGWVFFISFSHLTSLLSMAPLRQYHSTAQLPPPESLLPR